MKKENKKIGWKIISLVSICINGIMLYVYVASKLITPEISKLSFNLLNLLGSFCLSILVSIVYSAFTREEDEEKEIKREKELEKIMQMTYLKALEMAPTCVYPPTDQPIEDFNQRLNESISNSENYYYFSDRGTYVTKRIKNDIEKHNERLSVILCLQDICDDSAFKARKEEYAKRELQQKGKRTLEKIIMDEKLAVLQSLYVISKLDNIDIKVYLHKEISFARFEITDDLLVISFLPMLIDGKKYPPTLIYENEKLFRQSYLDYFNDIKNRATPLQKEDITIDMLLKMGKKAKIKNITEEDITKYYDELNNNKKKSSVMTY